MISFWMSIGTSVGFMWEGGGWGGLHCLSFFHYSCKLGKKAFTVHFDPRVLPNCNVENGYEYHQGRWYRGFVNMDFKKKDIEESVNTVSWGMLGIGETSCLFF